MQINKLTPEIHVYELRPLKGDKEYNDCLWARFTFDCDNGSLVIAGDAGEYSYTWGHNENEKFMHLMSRINKYYLMDKISGRYMLNLKESKKRTIEHIESSGYEDYGISSEEEWRFVKHELMNIETSSEMIFYDNVRTIVPKIDYEDIYIEKDYPRSVTILADWFETYLQPEIKKEFGK